jgi:hypothetical protein
MDQLNAIRVAFVHSPIWRRRKILNFLGDDPLDIVVSRPIRGVRGHRTEEAEQQGLDEAHGAPSNLPTRIVRRGEERSDGKNVCACMMRPTGAPSTHASLALSLFVLLGASVATAFRRHTCSGLLALGSIPRRGNVRPGAPLPQPLGLKSAAVCCAFDLERLYA